MCAHHHRCVLLRVSVCGAEVLSPAWPGGSAGAVFSQHGTSAARSDGAGEAAAQSVRVPQLQRGIGTDRPRPSGPFLLTAERFSSRLVARCHLQREHQLLTQGRLLSLSQEKQTLQQ